MSNPISELERNFKDCITNLPPELDHIDEVEFRIGFYTEVFNSKTSLNTFCDILNDYKNFDRAERHILTVQPDTTGLDIKKENYRVSIEDDKKILKIREFCSSDKLNLSDPDSVVMIKTKYCPSDNRSIGIRCSAAQEEVIEADHEISTKIKEQLQLGRKRPTKGFKHHYRYMKRYSFDISENITLDLSVVKSSTGTNFRYAKVLAQQEVYEVELEMHNIDLSKVSTKSDREALAEKLFKQVRPHLLNIINIKLGKIVKTDQIPSVEDLNRITDEYKKLLKLRENLFVGVNITALDHDDILKDDADNVHVTKGNSIFVDKADGERHLMLVASDSNVYLIDKKMTIKPTGLSTEKIPAGTLLDGELLQISDKNYFLAFDLLFLDGKDIRNTDFYNNNEIHDAGSALKNLSADLKLKKGVVPNTRYGKLLDLLSSPIANEGDHFTVVAKHFYPLSYLSETKSLGSINIDELNKTYKAPSISYKLDGLIIQIASGRNSHYPISEKGTKLWDHSMKWKPVITNDFKFNYANGRRTTVKRSEIATVIADAGEPNDEYVACTLEYYSKRRRTNIKLPNGANKKASTIWYFKLDSDGYIRTTDGKSVIRAGDIVECEYSLKTKMWIPERVRCDKPFPNEEYTIKNNLKLINNPITFNHLKNLEEYETYFAQTSSELLENMKKHHNSIKLSIYKEYGDKLKSPRLLDLGAGHLQDLHKWKNANYTNVVALDRSAADLEVGKRRLRQMVKRDKAYKDLNIKTVAADFTNVFNSNTVKQLANTLSKEHGFNLITAFFSMHYAFRDTKSFQRFCYNVSYQLRTGTDAYFIGTSFDRNAVLSLFNRLKAGEKFKDDRSRVTLTDNKLIAGQQLIGDEYKTLWTILLNNADYDTLYGFTIDVNVVTIGKEHREYIVPLSNLDKDEGIEKQFKNVLEKYGLEIKQTKSFSHYESSHLNLAEREFSHLNAFFELSKPKELSTHKYDTLLRDLTVDSGKQVRTEVNAKAKTTHTHKPVVKTETKAKDNTKTKTKAKDKDKAKIAVRRRPTRIKRSDK